MNSGITNLKENNWNASGNVWGTSKGNTYDDVLVVAGLDFGTTYSGYAYAFKSAKQYDNSLFKIPIWFGGRGMLTFKTPTAILFNKDGNFHCFGFDAEDFYAGCLLDGTAQEYTYFTRFTTNLFQNERNEFPKECLIKSHNGKTMSALKVFAESMRYFKNHLMGSLEEYNYGLWEKKVHWVLTIPAFWQYKAERFMKEAATQAGIELLTIAYEPEVAVLYYNIIACQETDVSEGCRLESIENNEQFLVLDCGGEIVDVTPCEALETFLKVIDRPIRGSWGGEYVDKEFFTLLEAIFGHEVWEEFRSNYPDDNLNLKRDFEEVKRRFNNQSNEKIHIRIPIALFETFEMRNNISFKDHIIGLVNYSNDVQQRGDKIRVTYNVIKTFFRTPVNAVINNIKGMLANDKSRFKHILMVGGFSDSPILRDEITKEFGHLNVLCPKDPCTVNLKGAVLYGLIPRIISSRLLSQTYGITVSEPFDGKKHPAKLKAYVDGRWVCTDIFKVLKRAGDCVSEGEEANVICCPAQRFDTEAFVEVYVTKDVNPKYTTDEGVRLIGTVEVSIPNITNGKGRHINIDFIFGQTELAVRAFEIGSDTMFGAQFDFL